MAENRPFLHSLASTKVGRSTASNIRRTKGSESKYIMMDTRNSTRSPEPNLRELVSALSNEDSDSRAGAVQALFQISVGGTERSAMWACALVEAGAIVPLLGLVQAVMRDSNDSFKPLACPENSEAVLLASDFALLVLAEMANIAASFLAEEGWDLRYDEVTNRPLFVDERSGLQQSVPPLLPNVAGDWVASTLVDVISLLQPLDVDPITGTPRWPVRVLRHIPLGSQRSSSLSVMDIAVEEGDFGQFTRVLIRGPWAGFNGSVEGEFDPNESPGNALDSWQDATVVAAFVLYLSSRQWAHSDIPRVLILGLRCGAVPAFLCKHFPGIRVDVVEPDLEVVKIGKDFFDLDFDEECCSSLGPDERLARLLRPSLKGRYRVWSGISELNFLSLVPKCSTYIAVLGDMPNQIDHVSSHIHKFQSLLRKILDNDKGLGIVALIVRQSRKLQELAAAFDSAWFRSSSRALALCDPAHFELEHSNLNDNKPEDGLKRQTPSLGSLEWEMNHFEGVASAGGVLVCRPSQAGMKNGQLPLYCEDFESWRLKVTLAPKSCALLTLAESQHQINLPYGVDAAVCNIRFHPGSLPSLTGDRVFYITYYDATGPNSHAPQESPRFMVINEENHAWETFGIDGGTQIPENHHDGTDSTSYWQQLLGNNLTCGNCPVAVPNLWQDVAGRADSNRDQNDIKEHGYLWGGVVVPETDASVLAEGIRRLAAAGWPPVCIFVCDLAWSVTAHLWDQAVAILGANDEVLLEPSLAAFKLDPSNDCEGRRYVGNNFGQPHRDYAYHDVFGLDSSETDKMPRVLSVWLPLVDVNLENGCMYVVPQAGDATGGRGEDGLSAPAFDIRAVRALAPAKAGTFFAWAGNTVHWGSSCTEKGENSPRISLAFVFRKKCATSDLRRAPLMREELRAGIDLNRRLELIEHSLACFEHWYGDTTTTRQRLHRIRST